MMSRRWRGGARDGRGAAVFALALGVGALLGATDAQAQGMGWVGVNYDHPSQVGLRVGAVGVVGRSLGFATLDLGVSRLFSGIPALGPGQQLAPLLLRIGWAPLTVGNFGLGLAVDGGALTLGMSREQASVPALGGEVFLEFASEQFAATLNYILQTLMEAGRRQEVQLQASVRTVRLGSAALVLYGNVGYGFYTVTRGGPEESHAGLVLTLGLGVQPW